MRKCIFGVLLSMALLSIVLLVKADSEWIDIGPEGENIIDSAFSETTAFFLLSDSSIYAYDRGGGDVWNVLAPEPGARIKNIVCFRDRLYRVDEAQERLMEVYPQANETRIDLPITREAANGTETWEVQDFQASAGSIYFEIYVGYSDEKMLCQYDVEEGRLTIAKANRLRRYCAADEHSLFYTQYEDESRRQAVFLLSNGAEVWRIATIPLDANGFAFDPKDEKLYFVSDGTVMSLQMDGAVERESSLYVPKLSEYTGALFESRYYLCRGTGNKMIAVDLFAEDAKEELIVASIFPPNDEFMNFMKKNSDVTLIHADEIAYLSSEEFVSALLTDSLDYDVLNVNTTYFDIELLKRKGYCLPIPSGSFLANEISQMYPSIQAAVFDEGFYAVPHGVNGRFDVYDGDLWEKMGFDAGDVPDSLTAFLCFIVDFAKSEGAEQVSALPGGKADQKEWLLTMAMEKYTNDCKRQNADIAYDTETFRELLGLIARAVDAAPDQHSGALPSLFDKADEVVIDNIFARRLTETGDPFIAADLDVFIVNPNCENPGLAFKYIECCLEGLNQTKKNQLYPFEKVEVINPYWASKLEAWQTEDERLWDRLQSASTEEARRDAQYEFDVHRALQDDILEQYYEVTHEELDFYDEEIAPYLYFPAPGFLSFTGKNGEMMYDIISRYLSGSLSDEAFISLLDQKMEMIKLEEI